MSKLPSFTGLYGGLGDWKYTQIYNPQSRLRVLVETCRTDSSQTFIMESLGHSSLPPTALGRQDEEEAILGVRSVQFETEIYLSCTPP
ncbi:hypothetical protein TNCV_4409621 [Trichonephila clavipes]|nr:hypothetical protein TNCV_4409621 [Trichonephila clavipes]